MCSFKIEEVKMEKLVTNIKVGKVQEPKTKCVAMASFTFAEGMVITGVKIFKNEKGAFISFPAKEVKKEGKTEWKDVCFPSSKAVREEIEKKILEVYDALN
jgi:DNA-binding cell septation regulator SpoVG